MSGRQTFAAAVGPLVAGESQYPHLGQNIPSLVATSLDFGSEMPATLASLPAELHARIASMCALQDERYKHAKFALRSATFPLAVPKPAERWTTVGALSVLSKYWNKVTEPYRFSKLKAAHLASRRFRFGFGRKFGRYITELDLSRLCIGSGETDPTVILDALPSLPNLRTVVTPLMSAVADAVVIGIEHDNGGRPDPQRTRPEVSFVTDGFLELFASVPSLVVYVLAGEMNVLDRLATRTPQTRQLVLYDHEDAELSAIIDVALVAIRSLPLLSELKLVTAADFIDDDDDDDDDAVRRFVVPPECHLRHLVLSAYAEFAAPLYELVGKLSPFLRSLELSAERFGHNVAVHERFLDDFHFPQLETLIVTTGDSAELGDLAVSLSPTRFPVLRRLELRVRSPANPPAEVFATTTDVVAAFASRPLPPLTVVADSVSTDFRRLQIDTSPLPAVDQTDHHRHSLVPSILLCDPFSRGYSWLSAEDQDLARHSRQTLEPLLDQVREMIHEAVKLDDCVQLRRVAHALQPCELLRIERNA